MSSVAESRAIGAGKAQRERSRHERRRRALLYTAASILLILVMFPFLWLLQMSVRPNDDIFGYALAFTPTFEHYRALWTGHFPDSFMNSVLASSSSTVLSLLFGVPAAYSLSRARFRARRQIALWVLASRMAPPIAFTIPFFLAYRYLGLLDTVAGLTLIYLTFNLALVIWMMQTFFDSVPPALEEAAWIDGCSIWEAFLRITLPLAAPGVAATAVLCFIFSWTEFLVSLQLTTSIRTIPVKISTFVTSTGTEWGFITALGSAAMVPSFIFILLVQRHLVRGLTLGSMKD